MADQASQARNVAPVVSVEPPNAEHPEVHVVWFGDTISGVGDFTLRVGTGPSRPLLCII